MTRRGCLAHPEEVEPNARLIVYDDAGHVPMEEIPERTARDVAAFLASTEG